MATTIQYLEQLKKDRQNFSDKLVEKGVTSISGDETFTKLIPKIDEIQGGGDAPSSTDIYHVATIEEMNTIPNPKENDYCLVIYKEMLPVKADGAYTDLYFPDKVVLDTPVSTTLRLRLEGSDRWGSISISVLPTKANISIDDFNGGLHFIRVEYTSTDSLTYTLNPTEYQNITLSEPFTVSTYNEEAAKFIYSLNINFSGVYQYVNNAWGYADIGIKTLASDVYDDKLAYTNNGLVNGILTKLNNNSDFKKFFDIFYYDNSAVTDMTGAFREYERNEVLLLNRLDTSNVTNMAQMFYRCKNLTSIDLSNFDTSKVTNMNAMFDGCSSLTSIDVSNFDTSNTKSIGDMFAGCSSLTSIDVSNFDTSNVTVINGMFSGCSSLTSIDLSNFNTSKITGPYSSNSIFSGCSSLVNLDISSFDTSKFTTMQSIFSRCSSLLSIDLSNFDTSNVTNMVMMFDGCSSLTSIDLSNFNTSNVTAMKWMFRDCNNLTSLDLSNFDTSRVTEMDSMFENCIKLENLKIRIVNCSCDLSYCPLMVESVSYVLQNLGSSGYNKTLTLGATNLAKATQADLDSATAKGWTIN